MQHLYAFHSHLILRTPTQPFSTEFNATAIAAALHDEQFAEALYLASPHVYEECRKWQAGLLPDPKKAAKLQNTLARYYIRMRSRCTPFGLFAGCAVVRWGAENNIRVVPTRSTRHTRLDMHYLCALAQHLARKATVRPLLRYWPQTSLYRLGDELRYVEYYYANDQRVHQISSVEASSPLLKVLAAAQGGATPTDLVTALVTEEAVTEPEAALFVQMLIESQLLVSELEPTVTGPEFLSHVQAVLARLQATAPSPEIDTIQNVLATVSRQLRALDQQTTNPGTAYLAIAAALQTLGVPMEPGKLFQTDLNCGVAEAEATLDQALQSTLLEAVEALTHLATPTRNQRLEHFKQRFQQRLRGAGNSFAGSAGYGERPGLL